MKYEELVKALRERALRENEWYEHGGDIIEDAAAAIEDLQAELEKKRTADCWGCKCEKVEPKRGEWKRDEKRWGENSIRCSLCGAVIEDEEWVWRNWNYCYHCGAKMEVQE